MLRSSTREPTGAAEVQHRLDPFLHLTTVAARLHHVIVQKSSEQSKIPIELRDQERTSCSKARCSRNRSARQGSGRRHGARKAFSAIKLRPGHGLPLVLGDLFDDDHLASLQAQNVFTRELDAILRDYPAAAARPPGPPHRRQPQTPEWAAAMNGAHGHHSLCDRPIHTSGIRPQSRRFVKLDLTGRRKLTTPDGKDSHGE
jgi:hypothetical protein